MAITHLAALRDILANAVDDHVNTGAGTAVIRIRASTTTLVDFPLQNPAFGAASSAVITLQGTPIAAVASAAGTADNFQLINRNADITLSGSVTATGGGGDIEATNTVIANAQSCELGATTYTAPV